ncbi:MAG: DUF1648 domain-containing protein [Lachnospiraceae bacterium]|nr:DUF1648 domain-containing protein [Lachnospiraceae bacterium]
MKNREFIRPGHRIAVIVSFVILLISIILAIVLAATTEGEIPTHFDFFGEIDAYGSPWTAVLLPAIMLLTNLGSLAIIALVPISSWNMPAKITDANRPFVYNDALWTVVITMLTMSLIALVGTIFMFFVREGFGIAVTGVLVVGIGAMVVFLVKSVIDSKRYA